MKKRWLILLILLCLVSFVGCNSEGIWWNAPQTTTTTDSTASPTTDEITAPQTAPIEEFPNDPDDGHTKRY